MPRCLQRVAGLQEAWGRGAGFEPTPAPSFRNSDTSDIRAAPAHDQAPWRPGGSRALVCSGRRRRGGLQPPCAGAAVAWLPVGQLSSLPRGLQRAPDEIVSLPSRALRLQSLRLQHTSGCLRCTAPCTEQMAAGNRAVRESGLCMQRVATQGDMGMGAPATSTTVYSGRN